LKLGKINQGLVQNTVPGTTVAPILPVAAPVPVPVPVPVPLPVAVPTTVAPLFISQSNEKKTNVNKILKRLTTMDVQV